MAMSPITLDQIERLAVDDGGRLYWDGQQVVTTLSLPWYVNMAIIVGALATVVTAAWSIIRYFLDRH
jgi:hypothetical protein